jgi:hypothetical protein
MTVQELIDHLQTLDPSLEVHFRGYSCGSVWHGACRTAEFREAEHMDTGKRIVEIDAEWN